MDVEFQSVEGTAGGRRAGDLKEKEGDGENKH